MVELRLGDQLVRYDRDATVAAYAQLERGDAKRCGCSGCRNFIAAREQAFPSRFKALLAELGIDPKKEGEVVDSGAVEGETHVYEGWFYFVGELVEIGERLTRIASELKAGQLALISTGTASLEYWFSVSLPAHSRCLEKLSRRLNSQLASAGFWMSLMIHHSRRKKR